MANKVPQSCYNEIETARLIVCFDKDKRNEIRYNYRDKKYSEYFILIIKYLLAQNMNYKQVIDAFRKHTALVLYYSDIYYYTGKKKTNEYQVKWKIPEMDKMLSNQQIEFDELCSLNLDMYKDNPFALFFTSNDYNDIKYCKNQILKHLIPSEDVKVKLGYLFKCFFDYFYYNCNFKANPIGTYGHNDLFLPLCLNGLALREFTFESLDRNYSCYLVKKSPNEIEDTFNDALLGHIIDIIFENNNCKFERDMKIHSDYYYNILLSRDRGKTIRELFKFFVIEDDNKARIKKEVITISFAFMYNNVKYLFTKDGIVKQQ